MTECVFCDLIGTGEAQWVANAKDAVAFLPKPGEEIAPGHTLVAPRRHSPDIFVTAPADWDATLSLVRRVGLAMRAALGATGVVVLNASGPDGGGSVPHLHFHIVPCWSDDEATFWPTDRSHHTLQAGGDPAPLLAAALR